jgi:hypothetical protein
MEWSAARRGPWAFEFASEEHELRIVNSDDDDNEMVLEMEVQELVCAETNSKVAMKRKDVLGASEDNGASKVVVQPEFVGVDPDVETYDKFVAIEGKTSKRMNQR